jgi:hypothetical protein
MSYQISWLLDEHVMYVTWSGVITIEDITECTELMEQYAAAGQPPVHLIHDAKNVTKYAIPLTQIGTLLKKPSPHFGRLLVVDKNSFGRFFANLAAQLFHTELRMFSTLEEATHYLVEIDSRVAELQDQLVFEEN